MAALGHRECCESATLSSRAAVGPATSISSATCQDTIKKKKSLFHTYLWDQWACHQLWGRGAPSCWSHWYCGANTRKCKLKKATKPLNSHTGEIFQSSVQMEQDTFKCISKLYSLILERSFPGRLGRWKGSDIKQCNFACNFPCNFALLSWRQRTFLLWLPGISPRRCGRCAVAEWSCMPVIALAKIVEKGEPA